VDSADLRRVEIEVSSVDSLSDEEEAGSSLFPVKGKTRSWSPNFGLALVVLFLMCCGIEEGRMDTLG